MKPTTLTIVKSIRACAAAAALLAALLLSHSAAGWWALTERGAAAAPPPPAGLIVLKQLNRSVEIQWDNTPGITSYRIYRSTLPGAGFIPIAEVSSLTFQPKVTFADSFLVNQVTYYYTVSAVNAQGEESEQSAPVAATPHLVISNAVVLGPDTNYKIGGSAPLVLSAEYELYRPPGYEVPGGQAVNIHSQVGYGTGSDPSLNWTWVDASYIGPGNQLPQKVLAAFIPDGLADPADNISYYYAFRFSTNNTEWVYAGKEISQPIPSLPPLSKLGMLNITPSGEDDAPSTPTHLAVVPGSLNSHFVEITWNPNLENDLLGYDVYRSSAGEPATLVGRVPKVDNSFMDNLLKGNSLYAYTVRAVDTNYNQSAPSDPPLLLQSPSLPIALTIQVQVPDFTPIGTTQIYLDHAVGAYGTTGEQDWTAVSLLCDQHTRLCSRVFTGLQPGALLSFQLSRGSAATVETTEEGNAPFPNHVYEVSELYYPARTLSLTVLNWDDPLVTTHEPAGDRVMPGSSISIQWNQSMPPGTTFLLEELTADEPPVYQMLNGTVQVEDYGRRWVYRPETPLKVETRYSTTAAGQSDWKMVEQQAAQVWIFTTRQFQLLLPLVTRPEPAP